MRVGPPYAPLNSMDAGGHGWGDPGDVTIRDSDELVTQRQRSGGTTEQRVQGKKKDNRTGRKHPRNQGLRSDGRTMKMKPTPALTLPGLVFEGIGGNQNLSPGRDDAPYS